jgi:hypothetical protein
MTDIISRLFPKHPVTEAHRAEFSADGASAIPDDGYLTSEVVRVYTARAADQNGNEYVPMLYGKATCYNNGKREAAQVLGELAQPDAGPEQYVVGRRVLFKDVPIRGRRYEFSMGVKRVKVASLLEDALALLTGLSKDVSTLAPGLDAVHSALEPLLDRLDTGIGLIDQIADFGEHGFEVYTNDGETDPVKHGYLAYISHPGGGTVLTNQRYNFNETHNQLEMHDGYVFAPYTASSYMVVRFTVSEKSGQYDPLLVDGKKRLTDLIQNPDVHDKDMTALQLRGMLSGVVNTLLQRAVQVLSNRELTQLETELDTYIGRLFTPLASPTSVVTPDTPAASAAGMPPAPDVSASLRAAAEGSSGTRHWSFLRKADEGADEPDVEVSVIDLALQPDDWMLLTEHARSEAAKISPQPAEGLGAGAVH